MKQIGSPYKKVVFAKSFIQFSFKFDIVFGQESATETSLKSEEWVLLLA